MAENLIRKVLLRGLRDIMFNKYPGNNEAHLRPEEKLYFVPGTRTIALPSLNIQSFLSAENTDSAPKRLLGKRWRQVCHACLSFVQINPEWIPFLRNGKPIEFSGLDKHEEDKAAGVYVRHDVARLKGGIASPQERPVLRLPWSLEFTLTLFATKEVDERTLRDLFERGGIAIGFGAFRGAFGKFAVEKWTEVKEEK